MIVLGHRTMLYGGMQEDNNMLLIHRLFKKQTKKQTSSIVIEGIKFQHD